MDYNPEKKEIITDREIGELDKFAIEFLQILEKYADYVIISGYVSILLGRTRATEDNIYHDATYGLHMDTSGNNLPIKIDGSAIYLMPKGNVGIGTTNPQDTLNVVLSRVTAASFFDHPDYDFIPLQPWLGRHHLRRLTPCMD